MRQTLAQVQQDGRFADATLSVNHQADARLQLLFDGEEFFATPGEQPPVYWSYRSPDNVRIRKRLSLDAFGQTPALDGEHPPPMFDHCQQQRTFRLVRSEERRVGKECRD